MSQYITLMGAEQVQSASSTMMRAADQMSRAAGEFREAVDRQQRFMEDWLIRFGDLLQENRK